ncbi:MAG: AzlD domain-containing protein, partial [bacterium]
MSTERLVLIFLGMWAATYTPRLVPLLLLSRVRLPDGLMTWLSYLPAAILSALIFPWALIRQGTLDPGPGNPALWALAASFLVAVKSRNLILTMVTGGAVMFLG